MVAEISQYIYMRIKIRTIGSRCNEASHHHRHLLLAAAGVDVKVAVTDVAAVICYGASACP